MKLSSTRSKSSATEWIDFEEEICRKQEEEILISQSEFEKFWPTYKSKRFFSYKTASEESSITDDSSVGSDADDDYFSGEHFDTKDNLKISEEIENRVPTKTISEEEPAQDNFWPYLLIFIAVAILILIIIIIIANRYIRRKEYIRPEHV